MEWGWGGGSVEFCVEWYSQGPCLHRERVCTWPGVIKSHSSQSPNPHQPDGPGCTLPSDCDPGLPLPSLFCHCLSLPAPSRPRLMLSTHAAAHAPWHATLALPSLPSPPLPPTSLPRTPRPRTHHNILHSQGGGAKQSKGGRKVGERREARGPCGRPGGRAAVTQPQVKDMGQQQCPKRRSRHTAATQPSRSSTSTRCFTRPA